MSKEENWNREITLLKLKFNEIETQVDRDEKENLEENLEQMWEMVRSLDIVWKYQHDQWVNNIEEKQLKKLSIREWQNKPTNWQKRLQKATFIEQN